MTPTNPKIVMINDLPSLYFGLSIFFASDLFLRARENK